MIDMVIADAEPGARRSPFRRSSLEDADDSADLLVRFDMSGAEGAVQVRVVHRFGSNGKHLDLGRYVPRVRRYMRAEVD